MLALTVMAVSSALAQHEGPERHVATLVLPPFVLEQAGVLTGFSIELWNAIDARLQGRTSFQMASDVTALLEAVRSKKADVAVSGLFYTSERDKEFEFSYPILNAGLQVMVRDTGERAEPNPLWDLLRLLFSKTILVWLGIALLFILIPAHVVWLLERRHQGGIIPSANYFPGILHGLYWAASTLATQAEQMPRQWLARIVAILWMFTGVVFVAFYTAQLTATLTVQQFRGAINGPDDLPGKRVATITSSTAANYLREHRAQVLEVPLTDEMYQALLDKKVDAVLFGAASLRYYAAHEGKGWVKMVGPEFNRQDVGIVFPLDSPLRKRVNGALLALREDGTYQQLYDKWFGSK